MGKLVKNLPPYYCQYNQIKLKETEVKAEVAKFISVLDSPVLMN
jgi:hypothetical protein